MATKPVYGYGPGGDAQVVSTYDSENLNPFAEGGALGPQHPVGGQRPGHEADPLTGERAAQHRNDFLYGGSETGAADFNAGTQAIQSGYGGALSSTGQTYGSELDSMGHNSYGTGAGLVAGGQETIATGDKNAYLDYGSLDRSHQNAANIGGQAESMNTAAGRLMNMNFDGPSAAEAQLNAGAAKTTAQNLALAQTGRGMGGGASARRQAMANNAQVMGATNANLASLRAGEEAAERQQAMQATQAAGSLYGGAGNLYGNAAGIETQNAATVANARAAAEGNTNQLGLGLTNAGLTAENMGIGAVGTGGALQTNALGQAAGTELQGQALQNQTNTTALAGTTGYEGNMLGRREQDLNAQATNQTNQANNQQANVGLVGQGLAALAAISDRRAKTDIQRIPADARIFGGGGGGGTQADGFAKALASLKASLQSGDRATGTGAGEAASAASRTAGHPTPAQAQATVRATPGYAFDYKDPARHGEGRRLGVMAQDLERTPAGAAAVMRTEDGTRAVDPGELSTINTAALHGVQKQTDSIEDKLAEIERRLKERDGSTEPDIDALDESYRREASGWR